MCSGERDCLASSLCGFDSHRFHCVTMGCWSKGRAPPSRGGNRGSTPRRSTQAGSSSKGRTPVRRTGNPGSIPGGSNAICPGGETEIMPRFERDVPGSIPGRGALLRIADCKFVFESAIGNPQSMDAVCGVRRSTQACEAFGGGFKSPRTDWSFYPGGVTDNTGLS
jgi:hypothetical protein